MVLQVSELVVYLLVVSENDVDVVVLHLLQGLCNHDLCWSRYRNPIAATSLVDDSHYVIRFIHSFTHLFVFVFVYL